MNPHYKQQFEHYWRFVNRDLWFLDLRPFTPMQRLGLLFLRGIYIVIYKFQKINCLHQASTLTFITLMSLVPMLAFIFSLAKGFQLQDRLMLAIRSYVEAMPREIQTFIQRLFELVQKTNFSVLGIIGLLILLWTVIKVLGNIEHIFNAVWGVKNDRPLMRKLADYILIVIVAPLMAIFSSTLNATVSSYEEIFDMTGDLGGLAIIFKIIMALSSMLGMVGAFSFLYHFIPNTKVKISSALVGGVVSGIAWFVIQFCYIKFQIGVARYNAIYGIFATLPIFLSWLYINWMLILVGALLCFTHQNVWRYLPDNIMARVTPAIRFRLAGMMIVDICREFELGERTWQLSAFEEIHRFPQRLLEDILQQLCRHRILIATGPDSYVPALPPDRLGWDKVYLALWGDGWNGLKFASEAPTPQLSEVLENEEQRLIQNLARQAINTKSSKTLLKDAAQELE